MNGNGAKTLYLRNSLSQALRKIWEYSLTVVEAPRSIWPPGRNRHQAVDRLPMGFCVSGRPPDGTVECLESLRHAFILGVQWHPELLARKDDAWLKLFAA